jgi:hypothetical protein
MGSDDAPAGRVERFIVGMVKGAIRKIGGGVGPYAVMSSELAGESVSRRIRALKRLGRPAGTGNDSNEVPRHE